MKYLTTLVFFGTILWGPWWLAIAVAVFLLALWRSFVTVLVGGMTADLLFGVPLASLFNITFFYTLLFGLLSIAERYVRTRMLD